MIISLKLSITEIMSLVMPILCLRGLKRVKIDRNCLFTFSDTKKTNNIILAFLNWALKCKVFEISPFFLVYDRNRIFGRKFRPSCRTFGQIKKPKWGKILLFFNSIIWIQYMLIKYFGVSMINLLNFKLQIELTKICLWKSGKKCPISSIIFGRIFGRKFRPMRPNIRFRPKLLWNSYFFFSLDWATHRINNRCYFRVF